MDGVAKVTVNFKAQTATIVTKDGVSIGRRAISKALKKRGYGITSFKGPRTQEVVAKTVYAIGVTGMR